MWGPCKENLQAQAAHQEAAGGEEMIFLCGVFFSVALKAACAGRNILDNNACGEAIHYEGYIFKWGFL